MLIDHGRIMRLCMEVIMRRIIISCCAILGLALLSGMASAASIQRVIIIQSTNLTAYLKEIDTLRSQFKKAGVAVTLRVWRARFAAAEAGTVVVTVEVADLVTLAKLDTLQASDPEISATMERIAKVRKIASDSRYEGL
jgi:hypothetical protein